MNDQAWFDVTEDSTFALAFDAQDFEQVKAFGVQHPDRLYPGFSI